METFIYIYSDLFFLKSNTVDPVFLSKMEGELMCSLRSSAIFSLLFTFSLLWLFVMTRHKLTPYVHKRKKRKENSWHFLFLLHRLDSLKEREIFFAAM